MPSIEDQDLFVLSQLTHLEHLRISCWIDPLIGFSNCAIQVQNLPKTLKVLHLDNVLTNFTISDQKGTDQFMLLPNLKSFACYNCKLDEQLTNNFHLMFPNINRIILKDNKLLNIENILNFSKATSVYIEMNRGSRRRTNGKLYNTFESLNQLKDFREFITTSTK